MWGVHCPPLPTNASLPCSQGSHSLNAGGGVQVLAQCTRLTTLALLGPRIAARHHPLLTDAHLLMLAPLARLHTLAPPPPPPG